MIRTLQLCVSALAAAIFAMMPAAAEGLIDAVYDPRVPTLRAVIGHAPGEAITSSEDALTYLEALEAAAPDRIRIVRFGASWQGRPLAYAIVASPENLARLDTIQANLARLGSGERLAPTVRAQLISDTPAVAWMSYGVHGDEITPTDSALSLAYHLLASLDDPLTDKIRRELIVIIDPNQNPDGRERFRASFLSASGLRPSDDRFSAEHDEPWPGGRFNHYLMDMNRDWFALTQPETRARIAAIAPWHPVVFVDSHEMSGDSTYFFPPAADPFNPLITAAQRDSHERFGRNRGAWFDRYGIAYFTREVFDAFYPGYGDMWPTLQGAIASTFEQGSPGGLAFRRLTGHVLTYHEGVRNNFLASLATLETAANDRVRLLEAYADHRAAAIARGAASDRRFHVVDLGVRRWQVERLARNLALQGIEARRLAPGQSACGANYPAGAIVIDGAQPEGFLIEALLAQNIPLPADFLARQEARRARGLPHELYDVTAWSVPLMEGLSMRRCSRVNLSAGEAIGPDSPIPALITGEAGFGLAIPWTDTGQAKLLAAALAEGFTGAVTREGFTLDGRTFGSGTAIFPLADNPADMPERMTALAVRHGAELVALRSSWTSTGPNFGSEAFARLKAPRVAMAWDKGTVPTSAGATRWTIEHKLGLSVTPIRTGTIGRADLRRYDVILLPETSDGFASELGADGAGALRDFVKAGGVLIGLGRATAVLAGDELKLLATRQELAYSENDAETKKDEPASGTRLASAADLAAASAPAAPRPDELPGALAKVMANPDHWLSAGYTDAIALVSGNDIYRPLREGDGVNVFSFAGPEDLVASGHIWKENRLQLAFKPFVMAAPHGDGLVIAFTQSPTTRGYLGGLDLLLATAILHAPARVQAQSFR